MPNTTHSPAPWTLKTARANEAAGAPLIAEIRSGNYVVANLGALYTERQKADAHVLMAAAELLDVAGSAVEFIEAALFGTVHDDTARYYADKMRAAMAKASTK